MKLKGQIDSVQFNYSCEKKLKGKGTHLFIKLDDKHSFDVVVNMTDRICDVIKTIKERSEHQGVNMRLMYGGVCLDDDSTVEESELVNCSVLYLMHGLSGGMQIFIKNIEGRVYTLEVSANDSIGDLKNKLYEKSGFAPNEQRLVYKGNCLTDDQTVGDVGLQSNAEINLVIRGSDTIKVHCLIKDGRDIVTNVQYADTVNDLKHKVCEQIGKGVNEIDLIFEKNVLTSTKTVREAGLSNECEVQMISTKATRSVLYLFVAVFLVLMAFEVYRWM